MTHRHFGMHSHRYTDAWTDTRLASRSSGQRMAPNTGGLFPGDFAGQATTGTRFVSLFPQGNNQQLKRLACIAAPERAQARR